MTPTPRLLVAMPTRGYPYAPSLLRANDLARRFGGELLLEIGRPIELVRTRIMSRFLESGADRILTIEASAWSPPAGRGTCAARADDTVSIDCIRGRW